MAVCTPDDVLFYAPEFSGVLTATLEAYISRAERSINTEHFGARASDACALYTAHLLTTSPPAGYSGPFPGLSTSAPVASVSVDDVSLTYAIPSGSGGGGMVSTGLARTTYGAEFQRLAQLNFGGFTV